MRGIAQHSDHTFPVVWANLIGNVQHIHAATTPGGFNLYAIARRCCGDALAQLFPGCLRLNMQHGSCPRFPRPPESPIPRSYPDPERVCPDMFDIKE